MTLQDIFAALSSGELSQLSIGGKSAGVIDKDNQARLIPHINLGLTALFKRFRIKNGEFTLELQPGVLQYELHSKYAKSGTEFTPGAKYISDLANPFKDDLLKVEAVLTELGYELPMNDRMATYSVNTPKSKVLVVHPDIVANKNDLPDYLKTSTLRVQYRANHQKILTEDDWGDGFEEDAELELPDAYMEALLYFVASRINNPIGMTNEFHAGNSYMMKYEQECQRLEMENLQIDDTPTNSRLVRNGWV